VRRSCTPQNFPIVRFVQRVLSPPHLRKLAFRPSGDVTARSSARSRNLRRTMKPTQFRHFRCWERTMNKSLVLTAIGVGAFLGVLVVCSGMGVRYSLIFRFVASRIRACYNRGPIGLGNAGGDYDGQANCVALVETK